jgi:hypothetical protein
VRGRGPRTGSPWTDTSRGKTIHARVRGASGGSAPEALHIGCAGCGWSGWARILAGVTGTTWAACAPAWVVPDELELVDCDVVAEQLAEVPGSHDAWGQLAALGWVFGFRVSPMTQRDNPVTVELVRAESWAALYGAASPPYGEPPPSEWQWFGVTDRLVVAVHRPVSEASGVHHLHIVVCLGPVIPTNNNLPALL